MASERVQRRLAAVLAGDVVGYSRLMGADEEGTLARLNAHRREFLDPKIAEHRGRIVKRTGDGSLVEFGSAVDAARCAIEIQRGMVERNAPVAANRRIELRMGIHVGDIIIEDDDIFGDGVNIAARLETIAQPGGICMSDDAYRQVRDKLDVNFQDLGEQELKNIARPVRVYRVQIAGVAVEAAAPALPDKPSIAVLPFQNMSGDPEQDYFADGVVEDIITALSRFRYLFVIARNSTFTYKGRAVDVKQVGRELGVRYVLEGSVRKAANRVRITGQLIDAGTGAHIWADRFDGATEDIFDLQDQVTTSVVGAIAPKLEQVEIERAKRKPTESLDAYDYYLRGSECVYKRTQESINEALSLFGKAIELDPAFAAPYGMAAWCYSQRQANRWVTDRESEVAVVNRLARRAIELGKDDALSLAMAGFTLAYVAHDFDAGRHFIDRALALNPNLAWVWFTSGWLRVWVGEPETAIKHFGQFRRMSPLDPNICGTNVGITFAHIFAGNYDAAMSHAEDALNERPNWHQALRAAATSNALAGRIEQARKVMARLCEIDPALRVSNLKDVTPLQRPQDVARYAEAMRKAGLPE